MDDSYNIDDCIIKFDNCCPICENEYIISGDIVMCENCNIISDYNINDFSDMLEKENPTKQYNLSYEQCKALKNDIAYMNKIAFDNNRMSIDKETINFAMDLFSDIRPFISETRNKRRRQYIAACLYKAGRVLNIARTKKEILLFCGLTDRNITTPLNTIDILILNKNINSDKYKVDIKESFIAGIFHKLNVEKKEHSRIQDDIIYILDILEVKLLVSSNFDSKIITAIYIALRLNGYAVSLKYICKQTCLHIETIHSIIDMVKKNHKSFTRFNARFNTNNKDKIAQYNNYKDKCNFAVTITKNELLPVTH